MRYLTNENLLVSFAASHNEVALIGRMFIWRKSKANEAGVPMEEIHLGTT